MEYRICSRCIMDTTDPEITFDKDGVCSNCLKAEKILERIERQKKEFDFKDYIDKIKQSGIGKKYDCIVGISGGVDSCYVMHLVKKSGLRPLAVHYDNGWDSELAVQNIKRLLEILNVDLYTYVVNWQEFRDLQLSFLKASTPDSEIPTDHMIFSSLATIAHRFHVKYIIMGYNTTSESILPRAWSNGHNDWKYIKNIHKRYGTMPLRTYPYATRMDIAYFKKKIEWFSILDYIEYDKEKAKKCLMENYDWKDYGGKHHESFYTKFYQSYILPVKFGYDKRKAHLSSLIIANQISRTDALRELENVQYKEHELERDIEYFLEKMQITQEEFEKIMKLPPKRYMSYSNQDKDLLGKIKTYLLKKSSNSYNKEMKTRKIAGNILYIASIPIHIWHYHINKQWRK